MPLNDEVTEQRSVATRLVLAHQLVAEVYHEMPDSASKKRVKDAGLALSDAVSYANPDDGILLDLDTFDRLRESDALQSDEYVALVNLCLHTMYPDEPAD